MGSTRIAGLQWGAKTDIGRRREHNEDSFVADEHVFAVADGVGGAPDGEIASKLAVETLAERFDGPTLESFVTAVHAANAAVYEQAVPDEKGKRMCTTLVAVGSVVFADEPRLVLANVGDSRAYRLRDGALLRLTVDHTVENALINTAGITADDLAKTSRTHAITRVIGRDVTDIDVSVIAPRPGDRYLICSDGLSSYVPERAIADTVRELADRDECAARLVDLANEAGGYDNVTVIVFDVPTPPTSEEAAGDTEGDASG